MKKFIPFFIAFIMISYPSYAHKSVGNKMKAFFEKNGVLSNYSKGGAYHDQASGYYTGGSFVGRVPIENKHFVDLQMPSINAGCGGIDLFMGGFGFINAKELIEFAKKIGENMGPYAFDLAMRTMSPEIASSVNKFEALATEMNQFNMNSCQSAQMLLGGVWPKSEAASQEFCMRTKAAQGVLADRIKARHGCGPGGEPLAQNQSKNGEFIDNLGDEYNLAWEAIQKNAFLKKDKLKAELFMSISGTILSHIQNESIKHEMLPSLALNNKLIKALIEGGSAAEIYQCKDKEKCLKVQKKKIQFRKEDGIQTHVRSIIQSITQKAKTDGELEPHEIGFIEQTKLPVLTYIRLSILRNSNNTILALDSADYTELIAYDILLNYLNHILDLVTEGVNHIRSVQLSDADIKDFLDSLYRIKKYIREAQAGLYGQAEKILKFNQVGRMGEQQTLHTLLQNVGEK